MGEVGPTQNEAFEVPYMTLSSVWLEEKNRGFTRGKAPWIDAELDRLKHFVFLLGGETSGNKNGWTLRGKKPEIIRLQVVGKVMACRTIQRVLQGNLAVVWLLRLAIKVLKRKLPQAREDEIFLVQLGQVRIPCDLKCCKVSIDLVNIVPCCVHATLLMASQAVEAMEADERVSSLEASVKAVNPVALAALSSKASPDASMVFRGSLANVDAMEGIHVDNPELGLLDSLWWPVTQLVEQFDLPSDGPAVRGLFMLKSALQDRVNEEAAKGMQVRPLDAHVPMQRTQPIACIICLATLHQHESSFIQLTPSHQYCLRSSLRLQARVGRTH
jgi:hypothetical protein